MTHGMITSSAYLYGMDMLELVMVVNRIIRRDEICVPDPFGTGQGRSLLRVGRNSGAICSAHECLESRNGAVAFEHLWQLIMFFVIRGAVRHVVLVDAFEFSF